MQSAARILAGYSLGKADVLRRAMGKKKPELLEFNIKAFNAGYEAAGKGE